jgi:hypothetical protein
MSVKGSSPALDLGLGDELPAYSHIQPASSSSPSAPLAAASHKYHLSRGQAAPWLTLTLVSPAASPTQSQSHSLPVYVEGAPVAGTLELDLPKEDAVEAVHVSVRARSLAWCRRAPLIGRLVRCVWAALRSVFRW